MSNRSEAIRKPTSLPKCRLQLCHIDKIVTMAAALAALTGSKSPTCHSRRTMEGHGLVTLKKNVREIEPIALATRFKIVIG